MVDKYWTEKHFYGVNTAHGHPITVAAERSGLNPDVLRAWERRYGAVMPSRGPGGQRVYTDDDIARLRLLRAATRAGRGIRTVAALSTSDLERLAAADAAAREERVGGQQASEADAAVEQALVLARRFGTDELELELRSALVRLGLFGFLEWVAAPFLSRIGDEWHAGRLSPAHEHHAFAVVHDLIVEAMRSITPRPGARRIVVSTLAGERHALGAVMIAAAAAARGWRAIYLGADLPTADIVLAVEQTGAEAVAVSVVYVERRRATARELSQLREQLPGNVEVIVGGAGAMSIELPARVRRFDSVNELRVLMNGE